MWVPLGTLPGLRKPLRGPVPRARLPPLPGTPTPGHPSPTCRCPWALACTRRVPWMESHTWFSCLWPGTLGRAKGRVWVCEGRGCGTSAGGIGRKQRFHSSPLCCAPRTHASVAALAPQSRLAPPHTREGRAGARAWAPPVCTPSGCSSLCPGRVLPAGSVLGCPDALAAEGNRGVRTACGDRADAHPACDTSREAHADWQPAVCTCALSSRSAEPDAGIRRPQAVLPGA